ncbi:TIGR04222 domain-containing membrane protein [Streptomyces sp. NPDC097619]|uniref:TIGR04222 domain-containing membrane protein n=1 Tax=Streptomyces sp. NPDC097619 TaxID=3157228 RepID=UPI003331341E
MIAALERRGVRGGMTRMFGRGELDGDREDLDAYQYGYLVGGSLRVAESAVVSLIERGILSLGAARVRVRGEEEPEHPVELAVIAACPRSKPVREVIDAVRNSSEVEELARRLVSLGLVHRRRRKPTRVGRRRMAEAVSAGKLPSYALHGQHVSDGLGSSLIRMGKALDDDHGRGADGGGEGGGSGGGGGD